MHEKELELLVDGKQAFPEIIKQINIAQKSIYINMFIWRDDDIGRTIALAILDAANRGVKVTVSADKYGAVLEKSEECKRSLFHKHLSLIEWCKVRWLELLYPTPNTSLSKRDTCDELYFNLTSHPNIEITKDVFKADHSKYYIFDDEILIMGGINIEDKENGKDMHGRIYQDYMVKLCGKKYVEALRKKFNTGIDTLDNISFGVNTKAPYPVRFEMRNKYLNLINQSKKSLVIAIAYFSPCRDFIQAIASACNRGVEVTVMISERANFQDDNNKHTMKKLLKQTNGKINVHLCPKMLHTKAMVSDNLLTLGSTNINKKAFKQLSELNLFVKGEENELCDALIRSISENIAISKKINDIKEIKYNKVNAFFESALM